MNNNNNIFLIKSSKAQASAPFEVLVAVILMGFVIMAGTWALINLNQSVCVGNKRQSMSELKTIIEDVVMGSDLAIKNVSFDIQPCFNKNFEQINLITYNNQTKCNAYCGSGESCTLMEYTYKDDKTSRQPIPPMCLNLPTSVDYATSLVDCGNEDEYDPDEWTIINLNSSPSESITSGKYRIFMKSSTGDEVVRKMCFLKKE